MNAPERNDGLITVLDVGSSRVRVLVAEVVDGALRHRGHGGASAKGMRKGLVAELTPAARSIIQAADMAEQNANAILAHCVIGVGGPHVRGVNSRGGITLGTRMREITREDVRSAVDRARAVSLPPERELIHLLPQQFILDEQPGIHDPVGMIGNRLEVNLHLSTCSASAAQSLVTCANKAGLEVTDTVFEGVAAAEATVSADERELGVCLIDIGAGSSEVVVFFEGAVAHTAVIPVGGDHFTNDIAVGLHVCVEEAEFLKQHYGNCCVTAISSSAEVEISGTPGHAPHTIPQRQIARSWSRGHASSSTCCATTCAAGGVLEALGAGCILTGGGARLAGLLDSAESLLHVPARLGYPAALSRMPDELVQPEYAAAIGMLLYTHRTRVLKAAEDHSLRAKLRAIFAGSL